MFEGDDYGRIDRGAAEKEPMPATSGIRFEMKLDRKEILTAVRIKLSEAYYTAKDIKLVFDDDQAGALKFTLEASSAHQLLKITPRKAAKVEIIILNHHGGQSLGNRKIITIDCVELLRKIPEAWTIKPKVLAGCGGLVKYPIGKGGILLNQINYHEKSDPAKGTKKQKNTIENMAKKRAIYSNLLRNMGCSFSLRQAPPAGKKTEKGKK